MVMARGLSSHCTAAMWGGSLGRGGNLEELGGCETNLGKIDSVKIWKIRQQGKWIRKISTDQLKRFFLHPKELLTTKEDARNEARRKI